MRFIIFVLVFAGFFAHGAKPKIDASQLVQRAEDQMLGKTFRGRMEMTIERPDSKRELEILSWTDGRKKAVVKVVKPAKDKGIGNLRNELDLWQYLPKVERLVKIPPSMMLQSWMGSDFSNDDLVKTSSFARDYTHSFAGFETIDGTKTAKIICTPKPDAPVVWGRLEMWIEPKKAYVLRQDFYSESGELIKRMVGSDVKKFGTHTIPSRLTMTTIKKNTSTTLEYKEAYFDEKPRPEHFNQNFLKSPVVKL